jgi:hypothetical protein
MRVVRREVSRKGGVMAVILILLSGVLATLAAGGAVLAGASLWTALALYLGVGAAGPAVIVAAACLRCRLDRGLDGAYPGVRADSQAASSASKV